MASLDPFGLGMEMEANKPSWYDALNGLPALFGSSMPETMELKRLLLFLKESLGKLNLKEDYKIDLAEEIAGFYDGLNNLLSCDQDDFIYWDKSYALKETYREQTIFGLAGKKKEIKLADFKEFLKRALKKLDKAVEKSRDSKNNTYSTYFINEVTEFKKIDNGKEGIFIKPIKFRQKPLPLFLEGFVHVFKITDSIKEKKDIHSAVRGSNLYDKALGMYKVNVSLEGQPEEIGRARVFTPGWLENESIWMHMQYKYLLELLESGLYEEFYGDFFKVLIPFQDPQRYGRSILENSSFIVSSAFPDKKIHGNGFVARLSGSTAEFLHIWLVMNIGNKLFFLNKEGKLCLKFEPILHKDLFTKNKVKFLHKGKEIAIDKNSYAFNFLGNTLVVYHNLRRLNTFGNSAAKVTRIELEDNSGKKFKINNDTLTDNYS
jgi:hypothetical protein